MKISSEVLPDNCTLGSSPAGKNHFNYPKQQVIINENKYFPQLKVTSSQAPQTIQILPLGGAETTLSYLNSDLNDESLRVTK
jgi:hypothetical protein